METNDWKIETADAFTSRLPQMVKRVANNAMHMTVPAKRLQISEDNSA